MGQKEIIRLRWEPALSSVSVTVAFILSAMGGCITNYCSMVELLNELKVSRQNHSGSQ